MHHKRKRPKNRRAGCLLCKPHKANGAKNKRPVADRRQLQDRLDGTNALFLVDARS